MMTCQNDDKAGGGTVESTYERLWSHDEAAGYLHISPWTLYHLCVTGAGQRRYRVGKHFRYDPVEVRAWLRAPRIAS